MGPRIILVLQLNCATGYFEGWLYGATAYFGVKFRRGQRLFWSTLILAIDYIQTLRVLLIIKIRGHDKFILRGQQLFRMKVSTGPWRIFEQAVTGRCTTLYGKINGATVNFSTGHHCFLDPVFP